MTLVTVKTPHLEWTLGDVPRTVRHVDDVVAGLLGRVSAFVDELADLLHLHRLVLTPGTDDLNLDLSITRALRVYLEDCVVGDAHALGLDAAPSGVTLL